jgi:zinc D-Ala-D-Ala carboxypeptidase
MNLFRFAFIVVLLATVSCSWSDPSINPDFSLSKKELEKSVASLPPEIRTAIEKTPKEFLSMLEPLLKGEQDLFIVADKSHPLGSDYAPADLVTLEGKPVRMAKPGLSLRENALDALLEMSGDAAKAGIRLTAGSTYRSYSDQKTVYAYWVKTLGKKNADRESAEPGYSQHQLGTTLDFSPIDDSFSATPACSWLAKHAWEYGFSLSYPDGYESLTGYKFEPWHYRFVGKAGAQMIEKYFEGLQYYFLWFYADKKDFFSKKLKAKK